MEISSISMARNLIDEKQADLLGQVQCRLLRRVMDQEEQNAQRLLEIMPPAINPQLGNKIDCYA